MDNNPVFIDSEQALQNLYGRLQGSSWIAVDTEFERVNTYYPELCLVQVTGNGMVAVIDTLSVTDLEPLYGLLYDPSITKVFHAARQDFELFFHLKGELPAPLFDTQIAASLLGYDQQIGYANLVREVLDVDLSKTQTRTDWKRRPLSSQQLHYAADDVIHLARLYALLRTSVIEAGRVSQLEEQCRLLNRPELYEPDPASMWRKIRFREVKNFNEQSLAVFKQLAAWREMTARRKNRPRKWIIKDHALVAIARELPADRDSLCRLDGIDEKVMERYGDELLGIAGLKNPDSGSE